MYHFFKVFHRIGEADGIDQHQLPVPVYARYVRFYATSVYDWNCVKVEVYGTESEFIYLFIYFLFFLG